MLWILAQSRALYEHSAFLYFIVCAYECEFVAQLWDIYSGGEVYLAYTHSQTELFGMILYLFNKSYIVPVRMLLAARCVIVSQAYNGKQDHYVFQPLLARAYVSIP